MTEMMWIRSHVTVLLQELCGEPVESDSDGDFGFRRGTAACWITILNCSPPMVRVAAHSAYGLRPTAKVLRELNDVQQRTVSARIDLLDDIAVVSQTISPIGLTADVLNQAMTSVGNVANDIGSLLAAMFDGITPFDAETTVDAEDGPS